MGDGQTQIVPHLPARALEILEMIQGNQAAIRGAVRSDRVVQVSGLRV